MDTSATTDPASGDLLATRDAGPTAVRGGGVRVVGYVTGALITAGSAALLFRYLGVVDTGKYVLVLSIVAIVAGVSDLGITGIGVRELSIRAGEDRRAYIQSLLGLRIVVSVLGVGIAALFAVIAGYGTVVVLGVLLGGVGLVLQSVQSAYSISLQSRLRLGWVALADFIRQMVGVLLIVVLVLVGAELLPFFAIPIVTGIVVVAITVPLVRGDIPLSPAFRRGHWLVLLRDILPFSAAIAAAAVYFRVAIVMVSLLATGEQLGYFSASFRVIEALSGIPALIVGAALPIFSRAASNDPARLRYAVGRVFDVSLILGAWIALELAVGSELAIEIIGGSKFAPAADLLAIQGIALGALFVGSVWSYALLSIGRYGDILRIYVVGLSMGSALVAGLIVADGARGAAIGIAITELAITIAGALFLRRARPDLIPSMRTLWRVALAGALAVAPALVSGLSAVALIPISTAIYVGVLAALGAIPPELMHAMRHWQKRRIT